MDLSTIKTKVSKAGSATITDVDFSQFTAGSERQFPILTGWASQGVVRDVSTAYSWAITEFPKFEKLAESISHDKDLTTEAKGRRIDSEANAMMSTLESMLPAINGAAKGAMAAAGNILAPTKPIAKGDTVQAILDVEMRDFIRKHPDAERQALMSRLLNGEHPELAQALLRADPVISGVQPGMSQALWGAGVVAAHRDDVIALGMFAKALRDIKQSISTIASGVAAGARGADAKKLKARSEALYFNFGATDEIWEYMKRFPTHMTRNEANKANAATS